MSSLLRQVRIIRYRKPLCEVSTGAKSNESPSRNPAPALILFSGSSPPEISPLNLCRGERTLSTRWTTRSPLVVHSCHVRCCCISFSLEQPNKFAFVVLPFSLSRRLSSTTGRFAVCQRGKKAHRSGTPSRGNYQAPTIQWARCFRIMLLYHLMLRSR